jgi:hypothetical protein
MTAAKTNLIRDAQAAGYSVREENGTVYLTKKVGRWQEERGLVIYLNGVAFDVMVDLGTAKGI